MNILRKTLLAFAFLACSNLGPAMAQNPPPAKGPRPKPEMTAWWDQPIARDLGLTEQQSSQIRTIVAESRDSLIQLKTAADAAEKVLHDLMNQQVVDVNGAQAVVDQVVATRAEMMRAVTLMSIRLRTILTYEQWQQLQRREAQPPPPFPGQPQQRRPQEED